MKKLVVLMGLLSAGAPLFSQALTKDERERGMSELHATRKLFLDAVAGLSEAQWNFKPAPEVWSVGEVAEHIAVSEDMIFGLVTEKIMKAPAAPEKRAEVEGKDEMILEKVVDRSQKFQAPEMLRPTHRWPTPASRDRSLQGEPGPHRRLRREYAGRPARSLSGASGSEAAGWLPVAAAHLRAFPPPHSANRRGEGQPELSQTVIPRAIA